MFFLLPILLFAALAVNTLASPHTAWPLRVRNEPSPARPRKEEFQLRPRTDSSQRNFSLPLLPRNDVSSSDRTNDRTPSPLSPRNFDFPIQVRDDSSVQNASTTSTGPVRPRDAFALRPRIRPRKSDSALIQRLALRQSNDSSIEYTPENPGSPLPGLGSTIPANPGINTTILAPNGTDITSNFKIMFYRSPSIVALDGLNEKQRKKRQTDLGDIPQTECISSTAVFVYSHCTPKGGIVSTTRTFQIYCHELSQRKSSSVSVKQTYRGSRTKYVAGPVNKYYRKPEAEPPGICAEDYICMDSPISWADPKNPHDEKYTVARCVNARNFKQLPSVSDFGALMTKASGDLMGSSTEDLTGYVGDDQGATSSNYQQAGTSASHAQDLSGTTLSLRLTGSGDRPLAANVEVDVGRARREGVAGSIESHPCPDPCLELNTSEFPQDTNWISAHARLVSTLAWAGVIWVAFFR